MNIYINVNSYYLSNETNPRFVAITVLSYKQKNFKRFLKNWENMAVFSIFELILTTLHNETKPGFVSITDFDFDQIFTSTRFIILKDFRN